jgi:hypothetical protein
MTSITLSALTSYPIKSCRGIALHEARVEERGLELDRRWMLVDGEGVFLTQRQHPTMALLGVDLHDGGLVVKAPGREDLRIPFDDRGERVNVRIWNDTVQAALVGHGTAEWFSAFLGVPVRLVFLPEEIRRPVDPRHAPAGYHTGFSDGYPILLISEASLEDLNSRLRQPVSPNRFRANLVVRGCVPYAEDTWRSFRIGSCVFRIVKPCARCVVTTVNPETGERETEPLKTLEQYRRKDGKVLFGQNVIAETLGSIRIGDTVVPEEEKHT